MGWSGASEPEDTSRIAGGVEQFRERELEGFVDGSGLFAVARHREAAHRAYLGLHALQHRGGRGVGIAVSDGEFIRYHRGLGSVADVAGGSQLQALTGSAAVGLVFGSPGGDADSIDGSDRDEMVFCRYRDGQLAVALAGRFTNGARLRAELKAEGAVFRSGSDAEVLVHLVAHSAQRTVVNRLVDALWKVEGAFSLVVCTEDRLIAVRDPRGFRPLVTGVAGDAVMFSSEDSAIRFAGGEVHRELDPGEMVIVDARGVQRVTPFSKRPQSACVHEYVGLAGPGVRVFGQEAYEVRVSLGQRLAREEPCSDGRVVVGLPGHGDAAAVGYARTARIPLERGLVQNPLAHANIEAPPSVIPGFSARLAFSVIPAAVEDRAVVLVVNSLVTGATLKQAIGLLRDARVPAVHLRIASPPVRGGCPYGVAGPTADELAATLHVEPAALCAALGADSVGFLSIDGMQAIIGRRVDGTSLYCDACFTGSFPIPPEEPDDQLQLF